MKAQQKVLDKFARITIPMSEEEYSSLVQQRERFGLRNDTEVFRLALKKLTEASL